MTEQDVIKALKTELQSELADELDTAAYRRIVAKTSAETGWSLPLSKNFQYFWYVERAKRHALYFLCTVVAPDFKYKQIELQQPWQHYWEMIKQADLDFKEALSEHPEEFPLEVDPAAFGVYIHAGFQYDTLGRDTTYDSDNKVVYSPEDD
jgi:hypothetical protein